MGCISQIRNSNWTHLEMKSSFVRLLVLHHKVVILVPSNLFSQACVFLEESKHLFCKKDPLTFNLLIYANRLHILIFFCSLCSHSVSIPHPFPDAKLCGQVMSGHQLDPKIRARSLAESSADRMVALRISVYILQICAVWPLTRILTTLQSGTQVLPAKGLNGLIKVVVKWISAQCLIASSLCGFNNRGRRERKGIGGVWREKVSQAFCWVAGSGSAPLRKGILRSAFHSTILQWVIAFHTVHWVLMWVQLQ